MATLSTQWRNEYQQLFDSCIIKPAKYAVVEQGVEIIQANRHRYEVVATTTQIPWYFIGIVHSLECTSSFKHHLHNGDPLTGRTIHVPRGYPKKGAPPFSWEDSAVDALRLRRLNTWTDWSLPGLLFQLEGYNGFGYRTRGIHSPYLWSGSNHYSKGKYTSDGIYSPNAISAQIGAAVLLRRLSEKQVAVYGELDTISQINQLGKIVTFDPDQYHEEAAELQKLLNKVGLHLRIDGKAGKFTSDAYHSISGNYLIGDSRTH